MSKEPALNKRTEQQWYHWDEGGLRLCSLIHQKLGIGIKVLFFAHGHTNDQKSNILRMISLISEI